MTDRYDHIVIGGGAAGCVAAARLARDGKAKVLLLEAGHSNRHPLLDMPPGIFKMINGSRYMRYHRTVAQPHLDGRVHEIAQGNVLGGGSSVNAQVYMRGRPSDYDEWDTLLEGSNDGVGWGWKDVLPHFRRMEGNNRLGGDLHGNEGPLLVSDPGHIDQTSRWFVQAVQNMGVPFNPDFNGTSQKGVGFYQFMNRDGKRSSSAYAFIEPEKNNPKLTVQLRCEVSEILFDGDRACGVAFHKDGGPRQEVHCSGDIVLSAGALVTPKLLMLSGIGPSDHLAEHGIACRHHAPGVGQNLIDHPEVPMSVYLNGAYGYYRQGEGWHMLRNGLQFKLFGTGPITTAGVEAGAFINPHDPDGIPSIQAFCVPIVYVDRDRRDLVKDGYGLTITTVVVKPRSRGEVRLASADPAAPPLVSPNLLKDDADMREMIAAQRFFLKAFRQSPLASRVDRIALPQSPDLSDEGLHTHCKAFVKTNYHPAGTARMGPDGDPLAVLDARMRVRGIRGLRVCDMSAVPDINAGNTNAPAMMLGDRCADMIMGRI
ncbi:GMC family oxidoreductase [Peteryoungia algae]|uniref:GMC family oxidoreductase N-terminal domain-containing protein n=1 Tax=Peteryoungia algae TaxID=2919917 RepID=A0ABT0D5B5_9HYPH|nr:GMC family oxidoreductase N-terminal domain-containing protein [Rhizobium sp. SSM4.3]MCJ8240598.1 GMC family oxidoreductase N-terminal domain-containing protein [Rhizobium sp. SSM4.3]